jgi:hypothetical protein
MRRMKALALSLLFVASPAVADVMIHDNGETKTIDCAKDKSIMIHGNKAKLTLTGTCDSVQVAGNEATITGSVKDVQVSGNDNKLTLDGVLSIKVSGNTNTITYKKSLDAKKKVAVANAGNGNKISAAK